MGNNQNWASEYYSSGSYLHRLYLSKNALFSKSHLETDDKLTTTYVEKKIKELKREENKALKAFAKAFSSKEDNSPEEGLRLMKNFLSGGEKLLNEMIESVKQKKIEKLAQKIDDNLKDEILNGIMADFFGESSTLGSVKEIEDRKIQELVKKRINEVGSFINNMKGSSPGSPHTSVYGLEGLIYEKLYTASLIKSMASELQKNKSKTKADLLKWIDNNIPTFTGDNLVTTHSGMRYASYDLVLKLDPSTGIKNAISGIPLQIKSKPGGGNFTISMVSHMNIKNLLDSIRPDDYTYRVIKTAIINQHYWGSVFYKDLIRDTAFERSGRETVRAKVGGKKGQKKVIDIRKSGYLKGSSVDPKLSSAHPTAIERLDTSQTLQTLEGVVPIFAKAIMYNIIRGVGEKIDTLFWIITTRERTDIIRSSDFLRLMMRLVGEKNKRTLKGKNKGYQGFKTSGSIQWKPFGHQEVKATPIVDASVAGLYGEPGHPTKNQKEWWEATSDIAEETFNKSRITLTFNYGVK